MSVINRKSGSVSNHKKFIKNGNKSLFMFVITFLIILMFTHILYCSLFI